MFILVRHAVAVSKQKWFGADEVRPLTRGGIRQSGDLVALLAEHRVTRLLSSPTVRCRHTLGAASKRLWVPVEPLDALGVHAPVAELLEILGSSNVDDAALCTHGETFAALTRAWRVTWTGQAGAPDLASTPKGGSWMIENYNTPAATATYLGRAVGGSVRLQPAHRVTSVTA